MERFAGSAPTRARGGTRHPLPRSDLGARNHRRKALICLAWPAAVRIRSGVRGAISSDKPCRQPEILLFRIFIPRSEESAMTAHVPPARKARRALDPAPGRRRSRGPRGADRAPPVARRIPFAATLPGSDGAASSAAPLVPGLARRRSGPSSAAGARRSAASRRLSFARSPLKSHKTRKFKFQNSSAAVGARRRARRRADDGAAGLRLAARRPSKRAWRGRPRARRLGFAPAALHAGAPARVFSGPLGPQSRRP
jgi:hypothetical protein